MNSKTPAATEQIIVKDVVFTHGEIFKVVDDFYTRIQNDPVLKVPFESVHDWPEHIERLTHFWWIRLGGTAYLFTQYNPIIKHYMAGFNKELLSRWLQIFHETLKDNLSPVQAELWTLIAQSIGQSLAIKNELYKQEQS